jgi:hypothetical protein
MARTGAAFLSGQAAGGRCSSFAFCPRLWVLPWSGSGPPLCGLAVLHRASLSHGAAQSDAQWKQGVRLAVPRTLGSGIGPLAGQQIDGCAASGLVFGVVGGGEVAALFAATSCRRPPPNCVPGPLTPPYRLHLLFAVLARVELGSPS